MARSFDLTYSLADQSFAQTKSLGIFNIAVNLLPFLRDRPEIEALTVLSNRTLDGVATLRSSSKVSYFDLALRGKIGRILWDQLGVYHAARQAGNEWLFLPKGFASFLRRPPVKLACWVADASHEFYREHFPHALPGLEAWYFERSFAATLQRSTVIFTISDFTRSEVLRIATARGWRIPPVVTAGIGFVSTALTPVRKQETLMVLTSPWPHKRAQLAIDYLARWQKRSGFIGSVVWVGRLPTQIARPDLSNWKYHARLFDAEYKQLVGQSRALVYFSDYEGFGMPPVEAIIAGTCPVYSDLAVTREVMGETGCRFANDSYSSFADGLDRAVKIGPDVLESWKGELLERHNWSRVAERIARGMFDLTTAR